MPEVSWIVKGEAVGLAPPGRDEFVERWRACNDPVFSSLLMFPQRDCPMPPLGREQRERMFDAMRAEEKPFFDIRLLDDGRFVGEAFIEGIRWPHASGELALAIFGDADRGQGYGVEACELICAYAFDALALHRMQIAFVAGNEMMRRAVAKHVLRFGAKRFGVAREAVWAFGRHRDLLLFDLLRDEFPPHPATAGLRLE